MRITQVARRASQALPNSETTRIIEEAARRASTLPAGSTARRPRGLRQYADVIAVGVASLATATAWKHRREHEEHKSLLEAELARVQAERDHAMEMVDAVRSRITAGAEEAIEVVEGAGRQRGEKGVQERVEALKGWMERAFESVLAEREAEKESEMNVRRTPKLI